MREQEIRLKAYRKEIEVLTLQMDVPYYEDESKRMICGTYENTLLRLFNNKRENKEILEIRNYYDSDVITIKINFTEYMDKDENNRKEEIEHLKSWFAGNHDIKNEDIKAYVNKGYIYEVDTYENNIPYYDNKTDESIDTFIEWGE